MPLLLSDDDVGLAGPTDPTEARKRAALDAANAKLRAESAALPPVTPEQQAEADAFISSQMTPDGVARNKPRIQNQDGSVSTERSITVQVDELNGGRPTNIPTIVNGKQVSESEAIQSAVKAGTQFPSFATIEEAIAAAQQRSDDIGRAISDKRPTGRLTPNFRLLADDDVGLTDGGAGLVRQFGAGANATIANLMDAPGTLMRPIVEPAARATSNLILKSLGQETSDTPVPKPPGLGVTDFLRDSPAPKTQGERVARGAGEMVVESLPFMAAPFLAPVRAGQAAAAPATTAQGVIRGITDTAKRAPLGTLTTETVAAASSGGGGVIAAEKFPDSPAAQAIGEILGGLGGGLVAAAPGAALRAGGRAAGNVAEKLVLPAVGIRAVRRLFGQRVETAAEQRKAQGRIAETVRDPQAAVGALDDPGTEGFGLTPAQRVGEPELLALERSIMDQSPQLRQERRDQLADVNNRIRESLKELGGGEKADPAQTRAYLQELLDTRLQIAAAKADEKIAKLGDNASRESANVLARRELDSALAAARAQERQLWGTVPQDIDAPLDNLTATFQRIMQETPKAQQGSIPGIAKRLLTPQEAPGEAPGMAPIGAPLPEGTPGTTTFAIGNPPKVRDVWGLRSEMLEVQRRARAGGRRNMARIAGEIADAALADLQTIGDVDEALTVARNFSSDLNDRFTRGPVGRLLGHETSGGAATPPGLTLESTVGRGGARAREETDALLRAMERTGDPEAMAGHIQTFLRDGFRRAAVKDGRINPSAAQTFLNQRQDVLSRFPQLRDELEHATRAGDAVRLAESASDPDIAAAAVFTRAEPGKEIARVLAAPDPGARMKVLLQQARTDKTGAAERGIRAAFIDHIAPSGAAFVKGSDLRRSMSNPKTAAAINEVYTPRERQRLMRIARAAELLEGAMSAQPSREGIAGGVEDLMSKSLAGVVGAHAGRMLNTGTIQAPGRIAALFERMQANGIINPVRKLLTDAVRDEELFRTLLMDVTGPRREQIVTRRLNAWAAGVLGTIAEDEAEE